jgi:serine/threonine protein kinase
LSDILKNETMHLTGEIILQITRDIAQGIRFLHSSKPPILHGDLKGRNILIDSRFRAKLCDFGLSTKKGNLITGTPFWLAPECKLPMSFDAVFFNSLITDTCTLELKFEPTQIYVVRVSTLPSVTYTLLV